MAGYGSPKQLLGPLSAGVSPPATRRGLVEQRRGRLPDDMDPRKDKDWLYVDAAKRFAKPFKSFPPWTSIKSAEWPPNPDHTGKRIDFGPLLSKTDAKLAYLVWSLADDALGSAWKNRQGHSPSPQSAEPSLARNVYEHLMIFAVLPLNKADAKGLFAQQGLNKTWDTSAIVESMKDEIIDQSPIRGVMRWSAAAVRTELRIRNLSRSGLLALLQERLIEDVIHKHCGVMPKTNLEHLEIQRPDKYTLQPATNKNMTPIDMYTFAIHLSPYNPTYWLSRAYCHYQQGYFDLAIGDAYRAQILCNTIEQNKDRYSKDGLYTQIWHAVEEHIMVEPQDDDGYWKDLVTKLREPQGIHPFISDIQKTLLNIICLSLAALNCWDDYDAYHRQLAARTNRIYLERFVADLRKLVSRKAEKAYRKMRRRDDLFWYEKHQGAISADTPYPYEQDEIFKPRMPPRKSFINKITEELFEHKNEEGLVDGCPIGVCEVKPVSNQQGLGVFAKVDIRKGQLIHFEEPTIRGHLPNRRMEKDKTELPYIDDWRCENCKMLCNPNDHRPSIDVQRTEDDGNEEPYCNCAFHWTRRPTDKRGMIFCPSNYRTKTCVSVAHDLYHFDGCGRNWNWLYDAMRPNFWKWRDLETISHSNEVHGTLLSLLLRSVTEITLIRRHDFDDPGLCPHEIDELLMLNGSNPAWRDSWFPFTMAANIIVPFDVVSFLGVNIFRDLTFDTWALQIILRKLLVNAVPWDMSRRGLVEAVHEQDKEKQLEGPAKQQSRRHRGASFRQWDPSFQNLYLYPGFSLFNHTCTGMQNADWAYDDSVILNRVLVWASDDIKQGEEIRFRYQAKEFANKYEGPRLLGGPCLCSNTAAHKHDGDASDQESDVSSSASSNDDDGGDGDGDDNSSGGAALGGGSATPRAAKHWQSGGNGPAGKRRRTDIKGKGRAQDSDVEMKDAPEIMDDDGEGEIDEYARFAQGRGSRVEIRRRLVPKAEDLAGEKRKEFRPELAGSFNYFDAMAQRDKYSPLMQKLVDEPTNEWLPKERDAMKTDRELDRFRIPGNELSADLLDVPQIARDPGESIEVLKFPRPDYGTNVNHWRNFKKSNQGGA